MRRIVLVEPTQLQLQSAEPPVPGLGEALVRIRRVGICGTDLHAFQGRQPFFSYPRVLGHEISAEVVTAPVDQAGENPDGLRPGEACVVSPYLYCGECGACRQGKTNCCARLKVLGVHTDGAMQDLLAVPAHNLVRAEGLTLDQMAMVENQSIGAHAVRRAQVRPGETALVVGVGPIGFGVAQFARLAGAEVLLADLSSVRLDMAVKWLAPRQALAAGPTLEAQLAVLTGGDLPSLVFDCTGSPASMMQSFRYMGNGGRLVLVGLAQAEITFHDPEFHRRETSLLASRNATRADLQRVITGMAAGQVVTEPLTTARVPMEGLIPAFPNWLKPEAGVLKALVELN